MSIPRPVGNIASVFLALVFRCRVYIKRPDTTAVKWNAYFAPFSLNTWNAVGLTIVIVGLAITTIDAFSTSVDPSLPDPSPPQLQSALLEVLFFVFGAFCGQGE